MQSKLYKKGQQAIKRRALIQKCQSNITTGANKKLKNNKIHTEKRGGLLNLQSIAFSSIALNENVLKLLFL